MTFDSLTTPFWAKGVDVSDAVVIERSCAKLNLFLEVLGSRDDGFHELFTVMHEIDFADEVRLSTCEKKELSASDPSLPTDGTNLALRALIALEEEVGQTLNARIELRKVIPAGGGLGGGSSNAAAVIRGANRLFDLGLDVEGMREVAGRCGSDTAFFVEGGTAICRGRGELIEPLDLQPSFWFVLLIPSFSISTPSVYGALDVVNEPREGYDLLSHMVTGDPNGLSGSVFNRLESAACRVAPRLEVLLRDLAHESPHLSGSGSTVFFVQPDQEAAEGFAALLSAGGLGRVVVAGSATRAKGTI